MGGLIFAIVLFVNSGIPQQPGGPWIGQAIGFVTMTVPFTLYFALCESSQRSASIGKRVVGLIVTQRSGEQLSFMRALLRNATKFVPWEFGHTLVQQSAYNVSNEFPLWLWIPAAIALIGPLWWLIALALTGNTPYDRWFDVQVVRSGE